MAFFAKKSRLGSRGRNQLASVYVGRVGCPVRDSFLQSPCLGGHLQYRQVLLFVCRAGTAPVTDQRFSGPPTCLHVTSWTAAGPPKKSQPCGRLIASPFIKSLLRGHHLALHHAKRATSRGVAGLQFHFPHGDLHTPRWPHTVQSARAPTCIVGTG